ALGLAANAGAPAVGCESVSAPSSFPAKAAAEAAPAAVVRNVLRLRFLRSSGAPDGSAAMEPSTAVLLTTNRGNPDRKSTRLNSSHVSISYAVFCLKKKKLSYIRSTTAKREKMQKK